MEDIQGRIHVEGQKRIIEWTEKGEDGSTQHFEIIITQDVVSYSCFNDQGMVTQKSDGYIDKARL